MAHTAAQANVKRRAESTVASGLNNTTDPVSFDVAAGHGTRFPVSNFYVDVENETLWVPTRSTDTFQNCVRAQDGTSAAAHANGVAVKHTIAAAAMQRMLDFMANHTHTGGNDGSPVAGNWKLIGEQILASDTDKVTFGPSNTLPQTYRNLVIRYWATGAAAGATYFIARFNGDTANRYAWSQLFAGKSGGTSNVTGDSNQTTPVDRCRVGRAGNNASNVMMSSGNITIMDYSVTKDRHLYNSQTCELSMTGGAWMYHFGGGYEPSASGGSNAPITMIEISIDGGQNIQAGGRFQLWAEEDAA